MLAIVVLLIVAVTLRWTNTGSAIPANQCPPTDYICEGRCPVLPKGAELPPEDDQSGLCLKDSNTDACVCWLRNSEQHLQTLFHCEMSSNNTIKHVMCLPPPICFPPNTGLGCMIVLHCPCVDFGRGAHYGRWRSGVAYILRSKTLVPALASSNEGTTAPGDTEKSSEDTREFSVKHLLFLLAFVIAPLLCWCMLTFLHEGKCRKKRSSPETEPMPTERVEEVEERRMSCVEQTCIAPTAPKMESPPPYREEIEPGESCLMAAECGPPPPYEDVVRDQRWRIEEVDSE